jgi:putative membrane protein
MKEAFKRALNYGLKGMAMGAANVIPGVSGGTIALITGIFERLMDAIKSFNIRALQLLVKGKFKEFARHVDLFFLVFVLLGIVIAIVSIASLFEYLFEAYPVYIWAFFFGLVAASVYYVARRIDRWTWQIIASFIAGTAVAVAISVLTPATENAEIWYLFICGIVAACSMILPGLSGSFVLILLGNYQLLLDAVNDLRWEILIPVAIGGVAGILFFAHLLSWVFKKFRYQTIGLLSGFIFGSLGILWPWKHTLVETFDGKEEIVGYDWYLPEMSGETSIAILIILIGAVCISLMEGKAMRKKKG